MGVGIIIEMAKKKKRKIKPVRLILVLVIFVLLARIVDLFFDQLHSGIATQSATQSSEVTEEPYIDPVYMNEYDFEKVSNIDGRLSYEDDTYTSLFGIDVSYIQKEINWWEVKNAGVDFAMIRVGYRGYESGLLNEDEWFRINLERANEAGVQVGVYFFSSAITVEEAREEARFVMERISPELVQCPIAYDMEYVGATDRIRFLTAYEITDITKAFVDEIKKGGYTPIVYGSANWLMSHIFMEELQDETEFWVASYQTQHLPYDYVFDIWQYTSEGSVPGISGVVDLNVWIKKK